MDSPATALSLFAGIGGIDLGLSLAVPGLRTVCYVEREAYCCEVLASRMEDATLAPAPIWTDVTTFDGRPWRGLVDCITGGFPCQDISNAGKRAGLAGERSGLWFEYARIIREVGPRYVFVENVAALVSRGLDAVLGTMADLGFDAEWDVFSAAEVGAPHLRKRLFLLAHSQGGERGLLLQQRGPRQACTEPERRSEDVLGYANSPRLEGWREPQRSGPDERTAWPPSSPFPPGPGGDWSGIPPEIEPAVCRVADGRTNRVDRLRALGNGVVPDVAALAWRTLYARLGGGVA